MQTVIGLDVGTTGTKAAVCDPQGRVLGKAYCEYELHFTEDGGVEQNAADWIDAVRKSVREAVASSGAAPDGIAAISLSTQGGSVWARGESGEALTPVMTWMDGRARAEAEDLRMLAGERLYRASGWQVGAGFDAAKLLWLNECESMIQTRILGTAPEACITYDADTARSTVLLVPAPFDRLYVYYVIAMCDYAAHETAHYADSMMLFNAALDEYHAIADYFSPMWNEGSSYHLKQFSVALPDELKTKSKFTIRFRNMANLRAPNDGGALSSGGYSGIGFWAITERK